MPFTVSVCKLFRTQIAATATQQQQQQQQQQLQLSHIFVCWRSSSALLAGCTFECLKLFAVLLPAWHCLSAEGRKRKLQFFVALFPGPLPIFLASSIFVIFLSQAKSGRGAATRLE